MEFALTQRFSQRNSTKPGDVLATRSQVISLDNTFVGLTHYVLLSLL